MSSVFSTRIPTPISCDQPVLTVSFPTMGPSANTVVLANGAVVDLNQLGALIGQFCPAFACQPGVVLPSAATASVQTVQAAPVLEAVPVNLTQTATSIAPMGFSKVQQTFDPMQLAQTVGNMFDLLGG